jgi:sporulation protein YlmC with PRC-barrel domain
MSKKNWIPLLCLSAALGLVAPAYAQVAGTTKESDTKVIESTQIAKGWSAKRSVIGQKLYNDSGEVVGKIKDLIISPDENISYMIVSAGGFLGIASHDVAIPVQKIQREKGKFVMPGANKSTVKAMPKFIYANNAFDRSMFVDHAEREISQAQEKVRSLRIQITKASDQTKIELEKQLTALQADLKSAQDKLTELKRSTVDNWREFEAEVNAALERLGKSREAARG